MGKRTFRCPVNVNLLAFYLAFNVMVFVDFFIVFPQFEIDALDVNAVGFIDETSNIIFSGSDNGIIKVYIDY